MFSYLFFYIELVGHVIIVGYTKQQLQNILYTYQSQNYFFKLYK